MCFRWFSLGERLTKALRAQSTALGHSGPTDTDCRRIQIVDLTDSVDVHKSRCWIHSALSFVHEVMCQEAAVAEPGAQVERSLSPAVEAANQPDEGFGHAAGATVDERLEASKQGAAQARAWYQEAHHTTEQAREALAVAIEAGDAQAITQAESEASQAAAESVEAARAVASFEHALAALEDVQRLQTRRTSIGSIASEDGATCELDLATPAVPASPQAVTVGTGHHGGPWPTDRIGKSCCMTVAVRMSPWCHRSNAWW